MTAEWPYAPYQAGGPVWDDVRFVDRQHLLNTLRGRALEPNQIGFILRGPRRSGKSSVLERLAFLLHSEAYVARLDLLSILGHAESWPPNTVSQTVLGSLCQAIEVELPTVAGKFELALTTTGIDIPAFRGRVLAALARAAEPRRLVVLFDELEVAQARDPYASREIVAALQPLPGSPYRRPFLGIVWGRSFGRGIPRDVPNPLKDFALEDLNRFKADETSLALQQPLTGAYRWSEEASSLVWRLTNGHPLFVAALATAIHGARRPGDRNDVLPAEISEEAISEGLKHAGSWDDAWRQLNRTQQVFLRALAEKPKTDLNSIISVIRDWGAPYEPIDVAPFVRGLVEDELIAPLGGGFTFQVEMIRRWVQRIVPDEILSVDDDPRDAMSPAAARQEREGTRYYKNGELEAAARAFRAALEMDSSRIWSAVWLGEISLQLDRPGEALTLLKGVTPAPEVHRIRAKVLARCIEKAFDAHEDPTPWITELRSVDPYHEVPQAARIVAKVEIKEWSHLIETADPCAAVDATDRYIVTKAEAIAPALRHVRGRIEEALLKRLNSPEVTTLVCHIAPYLLRQSEPLAFPNAAPAAGDIRPSDAALEWELCYRIELLAITKMRNDAAQTGLAGIPPDTLLELVRCGVSSGALGEALRNLIRDVLSADRLEGLALLDPAGTHAAVSLFDFIEPADATRRLDNAFSRAALTASTGDLKTIANALCSLPAIGLALTQILKVRNHASYEAHFRDLILAIRYLLDRLRTDSICMSLTIGAAVEASWRNLLAVLTTVLPAEAQQLQNEFTEWVNAAAAGDDVQPIGVTTDRYRTIDAQSVQDVLGNIYRIERAVPYRIHGVPPGYVYAWSVDRLGRNLLARAYRIEGGEPAVQAFLGHLWENERRLLSTLATRWEGRALPRLHVARFETGMLVLVTDFFGPQTLRDLLDSGEISRLRRTSRSTLWKHLHGLFDALAALHRAGYIHRAVRPENVVIDASGRSSAGGQWLRLANFEWSIYLYGIANSLPPEARLHDRYIAPERLALQRSSASGARYAGEGTTSDAFALGLLLYECLVEPLHHEELLPIPPSYGVDQHREWVTRLLERVDHELGLGLWADEVHLLKGLLQPDPNRRDADITAMLEILSRLTQQDTPAQAAVPQSPLQLVTTLELGTNESITRFIKEDLPEVDFSDVPAVASWICEQLAGAEIRPNRRAGAPVLLLGRLLNFTVEPFTIHGSVHRHVGWLKVARAHDMPAGAALGKLNSGVVVHNFRRDMRLAPLLTSPGSWESWFSAVEELQEGLTVNERAFVERIRWSIELERASWARQVLPYERIEYRAGSRPGERDLVVIKDRSDTARRERSYYLADLMAQSVDRDNTWFELGKSRDPTARFHVDRRWIQESSDEELGYIYLTRTHRDDVDEPPERGWVRPHSLAGHRTLYQRRKEVLADVERDPFLVRTLLTPQETFDDLNLPRGRFFDSHLDEDKKSLSVAIQNRRPLFVVQGPPGTGKTTLATEVILRVLHDQPSSRILVVSQAHDPLNHLLERVEKGLDGLQKSGADGRRPSSVRLAAEERLDERRYGREATRVPRKYHPSRVASEIMAKAGAWQPDGAKDIGQKAVDAWRHLIASHALHGLSRSLEQRLIASANLVYATANDRRLAALRPGSFDLVIYEETAKALPAEVLGPLRLARRWLLIGDQAQLPPFGIDDVDAALERDIELLRRERRQDLPIAADARGVDPARILGDTPPPQDIWAGIKEEMLKLVRFFGYLHQRAERVPLAAARTSPIGTGGAIKGLAGVLQTQWRMHPTIGDFVSKCFYNGTIKNGDPEQLAKWRRHGLVAPDCVAGNALVWIDIPWVVEEELATERRGFGGGYENGFEARAALGFLRTLMFGSRQPLTLAIMSPYRAQVSVLAKMMKDYQFPSAGDLTNSLHTADSFQGKQADVVIASLVRNRRPSKGSRSLQLRRGLGFLESTERSTVIFSRAEKLLVLAGCIRHFQQFPGTTMFDVVTEVRRLSATSRSGVAIVSGKDFIEPRHWDALQRYHDQQEERRRRRAREAEHPEEEEHEK